MAPRKLIFVLHLLHLGGDNAKHGYTMEGNVLEAVEYEKELLMCHS